MSDVSGNAPESAALGETADNVDRHAGWWLWMASAAALIVGGVVAYYLVRPADIVGAVAAAYADGRGEAIDLAVADPAALERAFSQKTIGFPTRVPDLDDSGFALVGGRVHHVGSALSAFALYRGKTGHDLTLQIYPGDTAAVAERAQVREHRDVRFFVHRRAQMTLVFWQEGSLVFALTSDLPAEAVIQLAFATAVRPA